MGMIGDDNRNPVIGGVHDFPGGSMTYQPEIWAISKDQAYLAIEALELALGCMPQIKTDVPEWKKLLDMHIIKMECALESLRQLRGARTQFHDSCKPEA